MELEEGAVEDEVKIEYDASEGVMKVEYKREAADAETETELKVEYRETLEYVDIDGDGAYTPDSDAVVSRYRVDGDMTWTLQGPVDVTSVSGVAGKKLVGDGAINDSRVLGFVLYAYGGFADVGGTTLAPTSVKIDILVDDFPYASNASALALHVKTEHKTGSEVKEDVSENGTVEGLQATANGFAAYFEWADTALVDGIESPVRATVVKTKTEQETEDGKNATEVERKLYLSYARGAHINHDPVLGVASASTAPAAGNGIPAPLVGAVLVAVVAAAAAASRNRARRQ